jgi:two-component system chemotaxis response regulator CheB
VVGSAADPYAAREKIKKLNPDVLTLDVEMPRMDGLTFLSNLMRLRPMPVVMVSSLTESGAAVTLQALELGAVDFVTKPKVDLAHTLDDYALEIREKVRVAAGARVQERTITPSRAARRQPRVAEKYSADVILKRKASGDRSRPPKASSPSARPPAAPRRSRKC